MIWRTPSWRLVFVDYWYLYSLLKTTSAEYCTYMVMSHPSITTTSRNNDVMWNTTEEGGSDKGGHRLWDNKRCHGVQATMTYVRITAQEVTIRWRWNMMHELWHYPLLRLSALAQNSRGRWDAWPLPIGSAHAPLLLHIKVTVYKDTVLNRCQWYSPLVSWPLLSCGPAPPGAFWIDEPPRRGRCCGGRPWHRPPSPYCYSYGWGYAAVAALFFLPPCWWCEVLLAPDVGIWGHQVPWCWGCRGHSSCGGWCTLHLFLVHCARFWKGCTSAAHSPRTHPVVMHEAACDGGVVC